jgi:hypothetical protein
LPAPEDWLRRSEGLGLAVSGWRLAVGGWANAQRVERPERLEGSRLLPTHRAAMLQSGSPGVRSTSTRGVCNRP